MSDSDSDSSDDDLLAGGPTFSKAASRKEKANEKKQLNFLDNLMSKATQRKERKQRIMAETNAARAAAAAAVAETSAAMEEKSVQVTQVGTAHRPPLHRRRPRPANSLLLAEPPTAAQPQPNGP